MDFECTKCPVKIYSPSVPALIAALNSTCPCGSLLRACGYPPSHFNYRIYENFPTLELIVEDDLGVINSIPFPPGYQQRQGAPSMPPPRHRSGYTPPSTKAYGQRAAGIPGYNVHQPSGTSTQIRITIEWDAAAGAYKVSVPYDQNFIEFIKAKIPGNKRAWDGTQKCWFVEEDFIDVLQILATELWSAAAVRFQSRKEVEDALRAQQIAQREAVLGALPPRERASLEFIELCPPEALRAAYRKAAVELHPDRAGGDTAKMSKLNAAWAALEKELSQNGNK